MTLEVVSIHAKLLCELVNNRWPVFGWGFRFFRWNIISLVASSKDWMVGLVRQETDREGQGTREKLFPCIYDRFIDFFGWWRARGAEVSHKWFLARCVEERKRFDTLHFQAHDYPKNSDKLCMELYERCITWELLMGFIQKGLGIHFSSLPKVFTFQSDELGISQVDLK